MVTFLDTGLISIFSDIFMFLIVYAVVWGVLTSTKFFGDMPVVYAIISLVLAFFVLLSEPVKVFIVTVAPWLIALAVVFMMIVLCVSMFSREVDWMKVLNNDVARTWIIILIFVVVIVGAAFSFGQAALDSGTPSQNPETGQVQTVVPQGPPSSTGTGNFEANFINTLFHPQVLGLMLIFGLGALIIFFLSKPASGP